MKKIKIKTEELAHLISEDVSDMTLLTHFIRTDNVIGEVGDQVVVLSAMSKAEATDVFDGDWQNLEIVE